MTALERRLGLTSVIGISISAMLGSGLFVLPGLAVVQTGPSVWLAYVVAGFFVVPAALSKAELATAMPVSGGTYVYIDQTLGPLASTIGGLGLWLSLLLKAAFALVGFGAYLRVLSELPIVGVGLSLLLVIVALNIVGVRRVGKVLTLVVFVAVVCLLVISLWGLSAIEVTAMDSAFSAGAIGFFATVSFVYISYDGVTKVAAIAEEVKDPGRNLPLGILLSLAIVTVLYGTVVFVLVGVVPVDLLEGNLRPIYTMARTLGGPIVGTVAAVVGILTMTSMANAGLLAASRFPFAMARDHLLPGFLAQVSRRFMTPVAAIIATAGIMGVTIALVDISKIAKLASSLMIGGFMVENLAVLVLRETRTSWYQPGFRAPFYPLTQIVGLLIGVGLLVALGGLGLLALGVVVVFGGGLFFFYGRARVDRAGALGRLGPRPQLLASPLANIEDELPREAKVVVPLMGAEHKPKALIELGAALADGGKTEVLHLREVPEQLMIEPSADDEAHVHALQKQIAHLAVVADHDVEFDDLVTRDAAHAVLEVSQRVHCDWVVLEWRDRMQGGLLSLSPLGWLVDHLACDLAILKDAGSGPVREILVLPEPGPHDALVATTADHLAEVYGAHLCFARFVPEAADDMTLQAEIDYIEQLALLCSSEPSLQAFRGDNALRTLTRASADYDLMIMAAPRDTRLRDYFRGNRVERLTREAVCSVLLLKTPRQATHQHVERRVIAQEPAESVLTQHLGQGCVHARVDVDSKDELFALIARCFAGQLPGLNADVVEAALWKRERSQNTSVHRGLALPHATVATADRSLVGVFTSRGPLDYKAPDEEPVDVFVATVGPASDRHTHLRLLAHLATQVVTSDLLQRLRQAETDEQLWAALR